MVGPQPGDVEMTYANIDELKADFGYASATPLEEGLKRFVDWYRDYHKL